MPPKGWTKDSATKATVEDEVLATSIDAAEAEKHKRWARLIDDDIPEDDGDRLKVPAHMIPDGMEYQWVTHSVFGQAFTQFRGRFEMRGWEPVPASRHDGVFMPKGHKGEIEVDGLVLMERPKILSDRARDADRKRAYDQVRAKEQQLRGGNLAGVTLDSQHPEAVARNKIQKSYERINIPKE